MARKVQHGDTKIVVGVGVDGNRQYGERKRLAMSTQAYKRLNKEYKQIQANPPPFIIARPSESNILDWHYIITGPPGTPYENGQYHGRITFPNDYPFKPPRIKMCTPSGRFEVNQRLCLSMSDFHEESWNPSWSVATIITGLLSFMTGDERTTGSIVTSTQTKVQLAAKTKEFNTYSNPAFKEVFPEVWEQNVLDLKNEQAAKAAKKSRGVDDGAAASKPDSSESEVVDNIEKIQDPEDKIRARLIKSQSEKSAAAGGKNGAGQARGKSSTGSPNRYSNYLYVILAVVFIFVIRSVV